MKTVCYALDLLALGKVAQASDILMQRLKAVHMAAQDGNWSRAEFMDLVPSDQASMTSLTDQDMASKELSLRKCVSWFLLSSLSVLSGD